MNNVQTARRLVRNRFGTHPLFRATYCEGARRVCDFLEDIVRFDLEGNNTEAEFWRNELKTLIPQFTDTV
jgi:hypothetical protein